MINVGVLGYGKIGSGVVEVIEKNNKRVTKRAGQEIHVKYILDLLDFPGDPIQEKMVHNFDVIVQDESVSIIVETMGGLHPAYEYVKEALEKGKSVCTSNKELVAQYGSELLRIAKERKVNFLFEASVGGGIPIIRPLNQSLTADVIEEITGILNGTTNYMLTKMRDEGKSYEEVLKEAQELGYAEKDPRADVEGYDACRKIAILTSLVHGKQVDYQDIYTEGITGITAEDFTYAKKLNATIKIFGLSRKTSRGVYAMVAPVMIDKEHTLYGVNDVFNAINVKGNMLGDVMFYGKGAGKLPTASAVVSDVVDAVKHLGKNIMTIWNDEKLELLDFNQVSHRFFVRVAGKVAENVDSIKDLFGDVQMVDAVLKNECAFITNTMTEGEFIEKYKMLPNGITRIRVAF